MNNYTLTIYIRRGADVEESKIIGNRLMCETYRILHRIMYGKKLAKKGGEIFYEIAETTLADCISIFNQTKQ